MINSIAKMTSQIASSLANRADVGSIIDQAVKGIGQAAKGTGANGSPTAGKSPMSALALRLPPGALDKLVYMSILNGAIQRAANSQNFNLETHINDLWTAFSVVRARRSKMDELEALVAKRQEMFQMLQQIIQKYNETSKQVIQSIGR
jgi:hypothetical protein